MHNYYESKTVNMKVEERKALEYLITKIIRKSISTDYLRYILEHEVSEDLTIMDMIIEEIVSEETYSSCDDLSEDDIRRAVGRVFMDALDIIV